MSDALSTYLHDHLGGATAAMGSAGRPENAGPPRRRMRFLRPHCPLSMPTISQDANTL
jgi:hypothetical protein